MILLFVVKILMHFLSFGNGHETYQPTFAAPILNISIAVGREAIFKCRVHHLGKYKVGWVKADTKAIQAIDKTVITHNSRISVSHESHNVWNLHIRDVRDEDSGIYMCQINTDPMINQIGLLEILIPPDFNTLLTSSDVLCTEGSTVRLKCTARGRPPPKINWRREDGREIIMNRPFMGYGQLQEVGVVGGFNHAHKSELFNVFKVHNYEGEILRLNKISRSEMGTYLCIASNGVPPSISKRITVHVHFPPNIYVPNQLVGAPLGTQVALECLIESYPTAIVYWVHNRGHIITTNSKYEININKKSIFETNMILKIRDLVLNDLGTYKCVAKNSLGETENNIRLYEILGPTIIPFIQNYVDFQHNNQNLATTISSKSNKKSFKFILLLICLIVII